MSAKIEQCKKST